MARPLIENPRSVPVVGDDADLPAVDDARLTEAAIRARLASPPAWTPEFRGDAVTGGSRVLSEASVLVGLVPRGGALHVVLTQRTAHLAKHAGQVSFPGGRREASDLSAAATALREAHEEVGLEPSSVDVLGILPTYTTVTNFVVTPVIGVVAPAPLAYRPDPNEVAAVFEVPLAFLMSPANHRRHRFERGALVRHFLSITWPDPRHGDERFVWGATASMLRNLYRLLAA